MPSEVDRDHRRWLLNKWLKEGRFLDGPPGQTAQWTPEEGAHLRPWQQSQIHEGRLRDPGIGDPSRYFQVPELKRRTLEERVQSLVNRLKDTPPALQEELFRDITGEYWKEGMPVSADQLRKVATDILNKADSRPRVGGR